MPPGSRLDRAQIIFFIPFFFLFPPLFPFLFPLHCHFSSHRSPRVRARSGAGRTPLTHPPAAPSPLIGGDPWLCRRGPSPRQRWADRAIQPLVTPPVTNRPQLTRTDGDASQADAGGESGAGSGPWGGCGRGAGGGTGEDGEVGLRWPSRGSPALGPVFRGWAGVNLISLTVASSQSLA